MSVTPHLTPPEVDMSDNHSTSDRPDDPPQTDGDAFATLLARAGAGDSAAFDALARQYESKVKLVARLLLGRALRPYVDSVDLLQSVHESVLIGLRRQAFDIADPEKLTALAVTIVRRKVARQWRRAPHQQRMSMAGTVGDPEGTLVLTAAEAATPEPGDAIQSRDQIERLCRDLNETDRAILEYRIQGLATAEIAERLSMKPIALRVRLTRLRQRLKSECADGEWL